MKEQDKELLFKALCAYLPYGLNIQCKKHLINYGETPILPLNGLAHNIDYWQYELLKPNGDIIHFDINEKGFKPILIPLSDLMKSVNIDGDEFIMLETLGLNNELQIQLTHLFVGKITIWEIRYEAIEALLENHFDIYGLIDKGLAIDINNLK